MASGLATRCTACGTVFRVVPDQLRVSEGWVRCGRCAEVFNAGEHLLDMHSGTPRRLGDEPSPALPQQAPERLVDPALDAVQDHPVHVGKRPGATPAAEPPAAAWHDNTHWQDDSSFGPTQQEAPAPPVALPPHISAHGALPDDPQFEPVVGDSIVSISPEVSGLTGLTALPDMPDMRATPRDTGPAHDSDTPSFLRRANRVQRWQQPRVRLALWSLLALAGLGLAAQVLFTYRDLAAARFAALRPALEHACGWLGCSVGDAHAIDSLVVDSSGLVRVEKSSVYKLSVALRNRAAIAVAVPAVEIALTDAQGKLLARRVLRAAELGASQSALGAGRDLALQATLQTATEPVAGYTIELFYP